MSQIKTIRKVNVLSHESERFMPNEGDIFEFSYESNLFYDDFNEICCEEIYTFPAINDTTVNLQCFFPPFEGYKWRFVQ
jgi:hypothetical protein